MYWLYLGLAIIFEVFGTTSMKLSQGFTKIIPTISMIFFYMLSFTFLTLALKRIDISVAYAIWSGVGVMLISLIGILFFKESVSLLKILSIILIVVGVVGLHLSK